LIGEWYLKQVDDHIPTGEYKYLFYEDQKFLEIDNGDTLHGSWTINQDSNMMCISYDSLPPFSINDKFGRFRSSEFRDFVVTLNESELVFVRSMSSPYSVFRLYKTSIDQIHYTMKEEHLIGDWIMIGTYDYGVDYNGSWNIWYEFDENITEEFTKNGLIKTKYKSEEHDTVFINSFWTQCENLGSFRIAILGEFENHQSRIKYLEEYAHELCEKNSKSIEYFDQTIMIRINLGRCGSSMSLYRKIDN